MRCFRREATWPLVLGLCALLVAGCARSAEEPLTADGRIRLKCWVSWTGFELEAFQRVVQAYNKSQDRIQVDAFSVPAVKIKTMSATAGGLPPDLTSVWPLSFFADKGVIIPLDTYLLNAGIVRDSYLPAFWDLCEYRGHMWALPLTPDVYAFFWNRDLFRKAGLNPDRPPRTIDELDYYNDRLTFYELPNGCRMSYAALRGRIPRGARIVQMGFLPQYPDASNYWCFSFGGELIDSAGRVRCADKGNVMALRWRWRIFHRYGVQNVRNFHGSLRGAYNSSNNAFISRRLAMTVDGDWLYNLIVRNAVEFDVGIGPTPGLIRERQHVTVQCDALAIPAGTKHPEAAFDFLRFVNQPAAMELLARGMGKISPLAEQSPGFEILHPNRHAGEFRRMAESPHCFPVPKDAFWDEYMRELVVLSERLDEPVEDLIRELQAIETRMQAVSDREQEILRRRGKLP